MQPPKDFTVNMTESDETLIRECINLTLGKNNLCRIRFHISTQTCESVNRAFLRSNSKCITYVLSDCNSFPWMRQSVLSNCNSFPRIGQLVLSDCNSFPRIRQSIRSEKKVLSNKQKNFSVFSTSVYFIVVIFCRTCNYHRKYPYKKELK